MNRALAAAAALAAVLAAGCSSKADSCHAPSIRCGDQCVDGSRDPTNCGGCGVTCGAGQTCCGSCVDLQTNAFNCAACGTRCPTDGVCTAGTCGCPPALPDLCGTNPGACVNLGTGDGGSCGQCGTVCAGPGVVAGNAPCVGGACDCAGGLDATNCSSTSPAIVCVNTLVDTTNCGGCGSDCPPRATCAGGACTCGSSADPDFCGTVVGCVNFLNDPANCGGCGASSSSFVCSGTTPSCSSGKCCPAGFTNCSGTCANLQTGVGGSCGTCGNACPAGRTCTGGTCVCSGTTPVTCGASCCAGTACCTGNTCQTGHSNGLGQAFFDCTLSYAAPRSTTRPAAILAAQAFGDPAPTDATFCDPFCVAGQKSGVCAIWCYGDSPVNGLVQQVSLPSCNATACPNTFTSPTWGGPLSP